MFSLGESMTDTSHTGDDTGMTANERIRHQIEDAPALANFAVSTGF